MPAENFSFEGSCAARTVQPEKFVRPDLSGTGDTVLWPSMVEMHSAANILLVSNCKITSMVACQRTH